MAAKAFNKKGVHVLSFAALVSLFIALRELSAPHNNMMEKMESANRQHR